jgi:hypothetical protein
MQPILEHWNIPIDLLPLFLDDEDGLAALALLCNADAKDWPNRAGDPRLYALKSEAVVRLQSIDAKWTWGRHADL